MEKLTILVDMDEVLNNLLDAWVAYLNARYNANARASDVTEWTLTCVYPFLSEEEANRPLYEDAFFKTLSVKPHSAEYLKKMRDDGHTVFVVTAASVYQTLPAKMDWLFERYPYLSWSDVIITNKKQMVFGDVLIDDGVHNLEGGAYYKILHDSPNNRAYDAEANGMARVRSLKEAYEIINKKINDGYIFPLLNKR